MPKIFAFADKFLHRNKVEYSGQTSNPFLKKSDQREHAEIGHLYATQRGTSSFLKNLRSFSNSAIPRRHGDEPHDVNLPYRLEERFVRGKIKSLVCREDQITSHFFPDLNDSEIRNQDYRVETNQDKLIERLKHNLARAEAQIDIGESSFYRNCQIGNKFKTDGVIRNIKFLPEIHRSDLKYQTLENGVCVASMQGHRPSMEDKHLAKSFDIQVGTNTMPVQIQGVFDGHTGPECSKYVKKNLIPFIRTALQKEANVDGKLEDINIYNACKIGMVNLSRSFSEQSGSTVNFSLFIDNKIVIVNTGDSRAILVTPESVRQLSEDAKPSIDRYRKTVLNRGGGLSMDPNGVIRVDGRLSLARAVGDHVLRGHISARPKVTIISAEEIAAAAGDNFEGAYLFHGCDGVFDVASSKQVGTNIQERLQEGKTVQHITAEIVCSSYGSGSEDNITGMLVPLRPLKEVSGGNHQIVTP